MYANNETGVIFPSMRSEDAPCRGILFHVDAVQAAGKIPSISRAARGHDFPLGHKLHAPRIGVLYVRKGMRFCPYLIGGHQEREEGRALTVPSGSR